MNMNMNLIQLITSVTIVYQFIYKQYNKPT